MDWNNKQEVARFYVNLAMLLVRFKIGRFGYTDGVSASFNTLRRMAMIRDDDKEEVAIEKLRAFANDY